MARSARAMNIDRSYIPLAEVAGITNAAYGLSADDPEMAKRRRSCVPGNAPTTSSAASEAAFFSIVQPRAGPLSYTAWNVRGPERSALLEVRALAVDVLGGAGASGLRSTYTGFDISHGTGGVPGPLGSVTSTRYTPASAACSNRLPCVLATATPLRNSVIWASSGACASTVIEPALAATRSAAGPASASIIE